MKVFMHLVCTSFVVWWGMCGHLFVLTLHRYFCESNFSGRSVEAWCM